MRSAVLSLLLCCSCAVGFAGLDEHGRPYAWGVAVLHAQIEACVPETKTCAKVDAQGLSENAAGVVKSPGALDLLKSAGWSLVKWGAGLLF